MRRRGVWLGLTAFGLAPRGARSGRGLASPLGLLVVVVALTGCQVKAEVAINVADNGSGTVAVMVRLDADAASRVPDLAAQLRVEDLRRAGWTVTGPAAQPDGSVTVRAEKPFARAADAAPTLAEVTGTAGPLSRLSITRKVDGGQVSTALAGTLDLSGGAAAFADPELTSLLGGRSVPDLLAGAPPAATDEAGLRVTVDLPGETTGNGQIVDHHMVWDGRIGDPARPLEATGRLRSSTAATARTIAVVAGLVAVVSLAAVLLTRRRRA